MSTYVVESFFKDPVAFKDYGFNWIDFLGATDTIASSVWTVSPATGIVLSAASFSATATAIWAAGGTLNARYVLTNHITTVGGRVEEKSLLIVIRDE